MGCGLTFVTEAASPASVAQAEEVAHEVLAELSPLLITRVWDALVRQVLNAGGEIRVFIFRPAIFSHALCKKRTTQSLFIPGVEQVSKSGSDDTVSSPVYAGSTCQ